MALTQVDSRQVKYTPPNGITRSVDNELDAQEVNVFRFLTPEQIADVLAGTFLLDVTAGVQAALNSRDSIRLPSGGYAISESLVKLISTNGGVKIRGDGNSTKLKWIGPPITGPILQIYSVSGGGFYQKSEISDLLLEGDDSFVGPNYLCGVQGLWIGNPSDEPAGGVCNCVVRNVKVAFTNIGINIHSESDEITVQDCSVRVFNNFGIRTNGSSGVRVINNHIQDPINDSAVGVTAIEGTALTITGNVIQTSASSFNGVSLTGVRSFTVANNYAEVAGGYVTDYFLKMVGCHTGSIYSNEIGGYVGASLIDIDETSSGINIGPNSHSQSGGVILSLVSIGVGATDINILGKQKTSGSITLISGTPSFITTENLTKCISDFTSGGTVTGEKFTSSSGTTTVPGYAAPTTFYTIPDTNSHNYIVTVSNGFSQFIITALVSVAYNSVPVITILYATSTNLTITVSGLNLQIVSNIINTVAMSWSIVSIGQ